MTRFQKKKLLRELYLYSNIIWDRKGQRDRNGHFFFQTIKNTKTIIYDLQFVDKMKNKIVYVFPVKLDNIVFHLTI